MPDPKIKYRASASGYFVHCGGREYGQVGSFGGYLGTKRTWQITHCGTHTRHQLGLATQGPASLYRTRRAAAQALVEAVQEYETRPYTYDPPAPVADPPVRMVRGGQRGSHPPTRCHYCHGRYGPPMINVASAHQIPIWAHPQCHQAHLDGLRK